ncbi:hypothetical protein ACLOAV_010352 [Pseudogymnoascus australis]
MGHLQNHGRKRHSHCAAHTSNHLVSGGCEGGSARLGGVSTGRGRATRGCARTAGTTSIGNGSQCRARARYLGRRCASDELASGGCRRARFADGSRARRILSGGACGCVYSPITWLTNSPLGAHLGCEDSSYSIWWLFQVLKSHFILNKSL